MSNKNNKQKILGKYVLFLNQVLGSGSYATVYKAINVDIPNKFFAVKILPIDRHMYDPNFAREIEILSKLSHPNVIRLYQVIESSNNYHIVLEYCDGGTLTSLIKKGNLTEEKAFNVFRQLSDGYMYQYKHGIFHRDLKPDNIMFMDGIPKICDYGFAKHINGDINQPINQTLQYTPLYASPQQLFGQKYSAKCDVWSMGLIFYQMIFGKVPFVAKNEKELINDIVSKTKGTKLKVEGVHHLIKDLIQKMVQYYEEDRLSYEEVIKHQLFSKYYNTSNADKKNANKYFKDIEKSMNENKGKGLIQFTEINHQFSIEQKQEQNQEPSIQLKQIEQIRENEKTALNMVKFIVFVRNIAFFCHQIFRNFYSNDIKVFSKQENYEISLCLIYFYRYCLKELYNNIEKQQNFNFINKSNMKILKKSKYYLKIQQCIQDDYKSSETLYKDIKQFLNKRINKSELQQQTVQLLNLKKGQYEFIQENFHQILKKILYSKGVSYSKFPLEENQLLYQLMIFSKLHYYFPQEQYQELEFNVFYKNNISGLDKKQLIHKINSHLHKFYK